LLQTRPDVEAASDTHPESWQPLTLAAGPELLPGYPQCHQDEIRPEGLQPCLQQRPVRGLLITVFCKHQLQIRELDAEAIQQTLHHIGGSTHQRDTPAMGSGIGKQRPGQLNPWTAAHLHALPPQSPDNAGTIRHHKIRSLDDSTQIAVATCIHRHLGIEGDDLTTTIAVQADGSGGHIPADINGDAEHAAPALIARTSGDCFHPGIACRGESRSGRA